MRTRIDLFAFVIALASSAVSTADESREPIDNRPTATAECPSETTTQPTERAPVALNQKETVFLDVPGKRLLLHSEVVLREGLLEMLCCIKRTKEHEAILSLDAKAYVVHAGLLALGAKSGTTARYAPEFQPATGQIIDIFLHWEDKDGTPHRVSAGHWIRNAVHRYFVANLEELPAGVKIPKNSELRFDERHQELTWYGPMTESQRDELLSLSENQGFRDAIRSFYGKTRRVNLEANWVFAGSGYYVDDKTGQRAYQAEGGDLICVANFPTATLDLGFESSASGEENLLFEADTERIPPLGTKVIIELVPRFQNRLNLQKRSPKKPVKD